MLNALCQLHWLLLTVVVNFKYWHLTSVVYLMEAQSGWCAMVEKVSMLLIASHKRQAILICYTCYMSVLKTGRVVRP